jgi:hypothetical protein
MATFAWQTGSFVIAEGIENEETLAFLRQIDDIGLRAGHVIRGGQGYGLGAGGRAPGAQRLAFGPCPGGGIGRRRRFKPGRPYGHGGSSPSPGIDGVHLGTLTLKSSAHVPMSRSGHGGPS